ncbi:MAG: hypothetical protein CXT70_03605 [Methanobacteriota archaeon]|nr:MAG: hypothetical protein CXT70_03605 [Euryarchaeota archaeon]
MKLTATLSCEQPYDIDDNLEDDVMSTFYKEDSIIVIESSDLVFAVSLASLLIIIAWFAGLFKASSTETSTKPLTSSQRQKSTAETDADSPTNDLAAKQVSVDDEITIHSEDDEIPVQNIKADLDMIEVIEEPVSEDTSALGRFASLRSEIHGDEDIEAPSGPIEDRMDDFFDN